MKYKLDFPINYPYWAEQVIRSTDTLETLVTFGNITRKETDKIFAMLLSDDIEIFQLGINIIEEKSKEL